MPWERTVCITAAFCALFGLQNSSRATVLRGPSEYSTIQEAIDASADGDVVLVVAGVYAGDGSRDIDFSGRMRS